MSKWSLWTSQSTTNPTESPIDQPHQQQPDAAKSNVSSSPTPSINKPQDPNISNNIVLPSIEESLNKPPIYYNFIPSLLIPSNSLYIKSKPTVFKRVLIIGVHGFFPNKMIRPLIGAPTGTSMKFTQVAEMAIQNWSLENNMKVEIQKIALEKEGKILNRVDFFFEILKNSIDDIKKADFIFVCSHSQGCPVSIILMNKLIEFGLVNTNLQRISILGMAGINIGPFYGMDKSLFMRAYSTIENDSLMELFKFQNFESLQSRKLLESLKKLVINDVKIILVGSIDDQLVPLYSALASHIQHPNIFKAVYIDTSSNTPSFLSRILKLSCILINNGYSDHDFIKEISTPLAGPITGGGHSRIYNDSKVYKLALDFSLKTYSSSNAINQSLKFKPFDITKLGNNSNPFILPWCTRGLFFEVIKKLPNGRNEIDNVFNEFNQWNPQSKILKNVKYRLNGIKAKL